MREENAMITVETNPQKAALEKQLADAEARSCRFLEALMLVRRARIAKKKLRREFEASRS